MIAKVVDERMRREPPVVPFDQLNGVAQYTHRSGDKP